VKKIALILIGLLMIYLLICRILFVDFKADNDKNSAKSVSNYCEPDVYTWQYGTSERKYLWKSFPRLPFPTNTTNHGQGIGVDEAWEFWNPIPDGLTAWYLIEGTNNEFEIGEYITNSWDWTNDRDINSTLGYKLEKDDTGTCLMFSRGLLCKSDTRLNTEVGEVWLGYFLDDSQLVLDAFPDAVINDAILIKTQNWGISRANTDSRWSGTPASCYINYADCVVIETVDDDHAFEWETPTRSSGPYYRPRAEHFTFDDEIDFIPVYATFDENDMPDEIAIYVDDVCRGAQVVEDTISQICAYILEEEQGAEIEFAFWYEGRSEVLRRNSYQVFNESEDRYENRSLITGMPGIHYEVSFKDHSEDIVPAEYNLSCYPNPFNPELTISFSTTESTQYTEITIFNVKGQKVKTLVSELFRPDDYNIVWKGDDQRGKKVSSGVYYIRLQVGDNIVNRKVILMK
jgi:Secretion system C-terminal sorting domain